MSAIPTSENLKEKAKVIRKFLKEKHSVDIPHGHCLDLVSQLFGSKDWNTASAMVKPRVNPEDRPMFVLSVGEMKKLLEPCEDSAAISVWGNQRIKAFADTMKELGLEQGMLTTEYSLTREEFTKDKVSFQLKCEDQYLSSPDEGTDGAEVDWEELKRAERK
jgi:hypothetical protein